MNLPSVTINIAVFNEERRIGRALASILMQDYPAELLDVVVVDGRSTDRSVEIARRYPCRVVDNPARNAPTGRRIGCEVAKGDLHIYMDADMEWSHPGCIRELVDPFLEVPGLVGSFPRFVVDAGDPALNRCLSYHPLQQDPLFRFLSTQIEDTVFEQRDRYALCHFEPGHAPVLGMVMYRTEILHEMLRDWGPDWEWSDVDFAIECADRGLSPLAYVPSAGVNHRSYTKPTVFLSKKRRDVRGSFLGTIGQRKASYIDWSDRRDVLRLALWVAYVNLLVPGAVRAVIKAVRHRDAALLYELFLETVVTDYVLCQFVADKRGRALFGRMFRDIVARTARQELRAAPSGTRS